MLTRVPKTLLQLFSNIQYNVCYFAWLFDTCLKQNILVLCGTVLQMLSHL